MAHYYFESVGGECRMIGGQSVWIVPPRITYSTQWPAEARAEVGRLRRALRLIEAGNGGDARELAGRALSGDEMPDEA